MTDERIDLDWTELLLDQLTFHWEHHLRPRLDGLTDAELVWEPAPGCWNLRPRRDATSAMAAGAGDVVVDFALPEPTPPPFTTIGWRLAHIAMVFAERNHSHLGGPALDYPTVDWSLRAVDALALVDDGYERWCAGVRGLGADGLRRPCGPAEGPFAAYPMAALVLHIHREAIHHGAEVLVLRDLYRASAAVSTTLRDDPHDHDHEEDGR